MIKVEVDTHICLVGVWLSCMLMMILLAATITAANLEPISGASRAATAGREWLATWRLSRKMSEGQPVPLPLPANYNYYANITELLHKSAHYPILHRCSHVMHCVM